MEAELRMQEAWELTEELLDHHNDDWVGLMAEEHGKIVELDKRPTQMITLIAGFEDSIAPQQQGGGGAARYTTYHLMFKKLKLHNRTEAAKMENSYEMEAGTGEEAAEVEVA